MSAMAMAALAGWPGWRNIGNRLAGYGWLTANRIKYRNGVSAALAYKWRISYSARRRKASAISSAKCLGWLAENTCFG